MNDRELVVKTRGLGRTYQSDGALTTAIWDVDFEAGAGELVLLLGPSGSGKTTLLALLAGLLEPTEGSVELFGHPVGGYSADELQHLRAEKIGFIFQNFMLLESLSVFDNLAIVRSFLGMTRSRARNEINGLLAQLGIGHLAGRLAGQISQGEKQRVAIARSIANGASLILADEPTANLETSQGLQIISLLQQLARDQGKCIVTASHDLRFCDLADRTVFLRDGRLVEGR